MARSPNLAVSSSALPFISSRYPLQSLLSTRTGPRIRQFSSEEFIPSQKYPHVQQTSKKGLDLLHDPLLNKGTAFTKRERDRLGIRGLVPPHVTTIKEQIVRIKKRLEGELTDVSKYLYLTALQDRNEVLFYKIITDEIKTFAPIIYTPTVGLGCQKFGVFFRRPRGMYISAEDRGEIGAMLYNWPQEEVDVIVVTDGSRILGLGDLGANGMGIPIGKLSLYTAAAGIDPARTLPILIDVGTNNKALREDPTYLGLRQPRVTGQEYDLLVEEFMCAVKRRWPKALIQFEDFSNDHAYPILHKYRRSYLSFNDDIQGTGAVTLAGIFSALRLQGKQDKDIAKQRIVCVGAGSAGLGVCFALWDAMKREGLTATEASENFWSLDHHGLITKRRDGNTVPHTLSLGQGTFARPVNDPLPEGANLLEVVKAVKPTILLGLCGVGGLFTKEVLKEMSAHVERPIIFPLSNPTSNAECTARAAYEASGGRAIFSSGSPFEPVEINGKKYYPSQGNNMFIFPGVGLAAVVCGARRISLSMFATSSKTLADSLRPEDMEKGMVYPDITNIRDVSKRVAASVIQVAIEQGLATKKPPTTYHDGVYSNIDTETSSIEQWIEESMWYPDYLNTVVN